MRVFKLTFILLVAVTFIVACAGTSWQLRSGKIAIKEGRWDRAIANLDEEIARMPENPEAWYLKGYAYEKKGDWVEMSKAYAKSLEHGDLFKDDIEKNTRKLVHRYYKRAMNADDSSRYEEALSMLDTALIISPASSELFFQAAFSAYSAKLFDRSLEYAINSVKYENENISDKNKDDRQILKVNVRILILSIYSDRKDNEKIIEWAQQVMSTIDINNDPENHYLTALDELVVAYEAKGEHDKAAEVIMGAIEKFPHIVELKMNLGTLMVRRNDLDEAMRIFKEVLVAAPDNIYANLTIGVTLVNQKQYKEAIPYLETVISKEANNDKALKSLASAYYNTGQDAKGEEIRNRLLGK